MIYQLDLRKKDDGRKPIILRAGKDCLFYWRRETLNQKRKALICWLRRGWYDASRYQPETPAEREFFLEGIKLRGNWRKTALPATNKVIPESWKEETFWVKGEGFRFANFPKGERDLRRAIKRWLVDGERVQDVCRDYGLSPHGIALCRAADALGFKRAGHGGSRKAGEAANISEKKSKSVQRLAAVFLCCVLLSGCTKLVLPDGTVFCDVRIPLMQRKANVSFEHEWLDTENVLHKTEFKMNTNESSDMMEAFELGAAAAATYYKKP